ncbi:MAG: hypothetical protein R2912_02730 [Eubacteriales bacterium]
MDWLMGTIYNVNQDVNVRAEPSLKAKKLGKANKVIPSKSFRRMPTARGTRLSSMVKSVM